MSILQTTRERERHSNEPALTSDEHIHNKGIPLHGHAPTKRLPALPPVQKLLDALPPSLAADVFIPLSHPNAAAVLRAIGALTHEPLPSALRAASLSPMVSPAAVEDSPTESLQGRHDGDHSHRHTRAHTHNVRFDDRPAKVMHVPPLGDWSDIVIDDSKDTDEIYKRSPRRDWDEERGVSVAFLDTFWYQHEFVGVDAAEWAVVQQEERERSVQRARYEPRRQAILSGEAGACVGVREEPEEAGWEWQRTHGTTAHSPILGHDTHARGERGRCVARCDADSARVRAPSPSPRGHGSCRARWRDPSPHVCRTRTFIADADMAGEGDRVREVRRDQAGEDSAGGGSRKQGSSRSTIIEDSNTAEAGIPGTPDADDMGDTSDLVMSDSPVEDKTGGTEDTQRDVRHRRRSTGRQRGRSTASTSLSPTEDASAQLAREACRRRESDEREERRRRRALVRERMLHAKTHRAEDTQRVVALTDHAHAGDSELSDNGAGGSMEQTLFQWEGPARSHTSSSHVGKVLHAPVTNETPHGRAGAESPPRFRPSVACEDRLFVDVHAANHFGGVWHHAHAHTEDSPRGRRDVGLKGGAEVEEGKAMERHLRSDRYDQDTVRGAIKARSNVTSTAPHVDAAVPVAATATDTLMGDMLGTRTHDRDLSAGKDGRAPSPYPSSEPVAVHSAADEDVRKPQDSTHTPTTVVTHPTTPRSRPPRWRRVSADRVRAAVFGEGLHGLHSCVTEEERLRMEATEKRARSDVEAAAAAATNAELFGDVAVDERATGASAWARAEHSVLDEDVLPRVVAPALVPPASTALAPVPALAAIPPAPPAPLTGHATTTQYEPAIVGIGTRRAGMHALSTTAPTHHSPSSPHVASMDDLDEDFDARERERVRGRVRREADEAAAKARLARYPVSASAELDEERWGWSRVSPTERVVERHAGRDDVWDTLGGGGGAAGSSSPASGDWVVEMGGATMEVDGADESAGASADAQESKAREDTGTAAAPSSGGIAEEQGGETAEDDDARAGSTHANNSGQASTSTLSPDVPTTENLPRTHQAHLYGTAHVRRPKPLWPLADMPRAPPEHAPPLWSALHRDAPRPQLPPVAMVNHLRASREELEALPSPRSLLFARVRRDAGAQSIGRTTRTRVSSIQRFGHGTAADAPKRRLHFE